MFDKYKVVAVTPAGRERYLSILSKHMSRETNIIDEWHLWANTRNESNLQYMDSLAQKHKFIKVIPSKVPVDGNVTICHFFKNCLDENTIYVRFDDDICYIHPDALRNLLEFRMANPEYFLVSANIINNAITSHIFQRNGLLGTDLGICGYDCTCGLSWGTPVIAERMHKDFLNALRTGDADKYKFDQWVLFNYERFSINCFAFFGRDFADFNGIVDSNEETWLTQAKPSSIKRSCAICGTALVGHFAYYTQRNHLERNTNLLQCYATIAQEAEMPSETNKFIPVLEELISTLKTTNKQNKITGLLGALITPVEVVQGTINELDNLTELLNSKAWPEAVDPDIIVSDEAENEKFERAEGMIELALPENKNISVLDFGCGEGHFVVKAVENGYKKVIGYDVEMPVKTNFEWNNAFDGKKLLTTSWDEVVKQGPYDRVVLFDVVDHATQNEIELLNKAKSVLAPDGQMFLRCHPWCSKHGAHLYKKINKAWMQLIFTKEELEKLGYNIGSHSNVLAPRKCYEAWFAMAKLKIVNLSTDRTSIDDFFLKTPLVKARILKTYHQSQFPVHQMEQSFLDYTLKN